MVYVYTLYFILEVYSQVYYIYIIHIYIYIYNLMPGIWSKPLIIYILIRKSISPTSENARGRLCTLLNMKPKSP